MTDRPTPTTGSTAREPRTPGRCWCGHVRVSHRPWADGEFCTREACGCRHYSEKRRGGEVIENPLAASPSVTEPALYPGTEEQMERDHRDAGLWRQHTISVFCESCIDGFVNSAGTEPCPDCLGTGRIRVCPHMWEGAPEDE